MKCIKRFFQRRRVTKLVNIAIETKNPKPILDYIHKDKYAYITILINSEDSLKFDTVMQNIIWENVK